MKKILILCCLILGQSGAIAQYQSMQFDTASGEQYRIPLEDLEIVYTDGNMVATQGWRNVTIPLTELSTMQFSEEEAGVNQIRIDNENPVYAYGLNGTARGCYTSIEAMKAELPEGIYIIRQKDGVTFKINLTK